MNISVLIIEDDPFMRDIIKSTICKIHGIEVVGEVGDGITAMEQYDMLHPRVVIIDIDLPRKNGLEVAKEIFEINPWTFIIFCTGSADYREKAFEVYAFDYLVKPFQPGRLLETMNRIINVANGKNCDSEIVIPNKRNETMRQTKLYKGQYGELALVDINDIFFFTKENRKTVVYHSFGKAYADETLEVLEKEFKKHLFFRSHKAFLINLQKVNKIKPAGKHTYEIIMTPRMEENPLLSWRNLKKLEQLLN